MSGTNYIASNWRTPENSNSSKNDNYSLDFNGSSDFISCGNDPQIQLTGDISISAWFKTSSTGTMIIAAKRDSPLGGNTYGWQLYCSGGVVRFLVTRSGPTSTSITGTTTISDGAWHHVLCTINQDSQIAIILDGSTEGTASLPAGTFIDSGSDLRIGYNQIGSAHYYFNGEISEVALFDYLVSGATLYGDATSGAGNPMALKPTPVGYWPLGDNSASDPLAQPNVAVEDASVFDFDGSDFIELNSATSTSGTDWSISCWIKTTQTGGNRIILSSTGGGSGASKYFGVNFGKLVFYSSDNTFDITSVLSVNDGNWHNIVFTYNYTSGAWILYIDDSVDTSQTATTGIDIPNWNSLGARLSANFYTGNMSNVAYFNTELSEPNVTSIYNSGVPGDLSSLNPTAWWKLDESANWEADTVGAWQIPDAVSEFPQSFNFSPVDEYFDTGDNPLIGASNLSMSVWFNSADVDFQYPLGDNSLKFNIKQSNGDTRVSFTGSVDPFRAFGVPYNISEWNHLILTFDGSLDQADRLKLYHNGVPLSNINAGTPNTTLLLNTYTGFKIGRGGSSAIGNWNGKISNVQLWDATLTPEKVTTLYNGGTPTLTPPNQSDLKGWYKLDNTELFDGNNWSLQNQVYPANYESALDFNGSSYINAGASTLSGETALSISAWVKPAAYGSAAAESFVSTDAASPRAFYLGLFNGTNFRFSLSTNGTSLTSLDTASSTVDLNVWQHILVTWDQVNLKLYKNGVLLKTVATTSSSNGTFTTANDLLIGARRSSAGFFNGEINNVAIFDSALDLSAAQAIYNNGTPEASISSSPISWWKLDNLTTGIQDSVGSNDGTNNGATKINTFVSNEASASTGMTEQSLVNNNVSTLNGESSGMTSGNLVLSNLSRNLPYENYSLQFDGTEYIDCGNILDFTGSFSLSAWVKTSSSTGGVVIAKDDNPGGVGNNRKFLLQVLNSTGKGRILVWHTNESTFASVQTTSAINDGNWHHISVVNDISGDLKIYVDGVDDSASVVSGVTPLNPTTVNLYIGAREYPTSELFLDGLISQVSAYDSALTSTEIQKLYANGMPQDLTTFTPQPVSWWTLGKESFWDGADWVIRDMIGTNDGLSDNMGGNELKGDAPRSQANGVGTNIAVPTDLEGNAGWSDKNGYSINMGPLARTTDTP